MKTLLCLMALLTPGLGAAAPVALWTSDPVLPGQTVLVFGDGFAGCHRVHWERLPDMAAGRAAGDVAPLQVRPRSVKFVLPASVAPGVFRAAISTPGGSVNVWINRPQITWAQGDAGAEATPGGFVRVFGKCLTARGEQPMIRVEGAGRILSLKPARAEPFTVQATLPVSLTPGPYRVAVHSGAGGSGAWSEPIRFRVVARTAPPGHRIAAPPAIGDADEDTAAIQKALDGAGQGGGVVILRAGRYLLNDGLTIPPHVTLRGAGMARTALCWADTETPPDALIRGHDHFAVENLCLYAVNYRHGIVADQTTPTAGYVRMARVRMRLDPYRGHLTPEEVNKRFQEAQKLSTGGGDSLRLGGADVEVTGCDIYGAGRCLYLSRGAGVWIHDNAFYNGRWGWYCISGSDGVTFERNTITGGDLMSTGGGLNCLDGSNVSQNVYFA
ncbi:MAG: right-handed parallel beta-helix repeat-containing protein, partial [Armatimonadetes bacterium]|nr:right-handed parallel beta-helix repeat-containing protein [Armatimonadota bacterium]